MFIDDISFTSQDGADRPATQAEYAARPERKREIALAEGRIEPGMTAPQAVGYVADDGSVFLKRSDGWVELN